MGDLLHAVFDLILCSLICHGRHRDGRFSNEPQETQHENHLERDLLSLTTGIFGIEK